MPCEAGSVYPVSPPHPDTTIQGLPSGWMLLRSIGGVAR